MGRGQLADDLEYVGQHISEAHREVQKTGRNLHLLLEYLVVAVLMLLAREIARLRES